MGSHGVAQRYLIQALGLARSAGDSALIAELLCAMSQQSTYLRDRKPPISLEQLEQWPTGVATSR